MSKAAAAATPMGLLVLGWAMCEQCDSDLHSAPTAEEVRSTRTYSPHNTAWRGPVQDYMHGRAYFERNDGILTEEEAYRRIEEQRPAAVPEQSDLTDQYTELREQALEDQARELRERAAQHGRTLDETAEQCNARLIEATRQLEASLSTWCVRAGEVLNDYEGRNYAIFRLPSDILPDNLYVEMSKVAWVNNVLRLVERRCGLIPQEAKPAILADLIHDLARQNRPYNYITLRECTAWEDDGYQAFLNRAGTIINEYRRN